MRTNHDALRPHRPGMVTAEGLIPKTAALALFTLCESPDTVISSHETGTTGHFWTTLALAGPTITVVSAFSPVPWEWASTTDDPREATVSAQRHRVDAVASVGLTEVVRQRPEFHDDDGTLLGYGVWTVKMHDGQAHRFPELGYQSETATDPAEFCQALLARMTP